MSLTTDKPIPYYAADATPRGFRSPECAGCAAHPGAWHAILKAEPNVAKDYVEHREGVYYIAGARVSLESIVYAFLRGEAPEGIADSFPAIELEQVYGAIAYYLAHRGAIDAYLKQGEAEFARLRGESRRRYPHLYMKLEAARQAASDRRA